MDAVHLSQMQLNQSLKILADTKLLVKPFTKKTSYVICQSSLSYLVIHSVCCELSNDKSSSCSLGKG